ncbi:hypothetical protein D3C75_906140 [compost metagenome]
MQAGLEVLPEQYQGLDEHPFPIRAVQRLRLYLVDTDADAFHEARLGMEDLEQRQRGELPRQLEAVQRRPRDFAALAFAIAGR